MPCIYSVVKVKNKAKSGVPQEYEPASAVEEVFRRLLLSYKFSESSNPMMVGDRIFEASNMVVKMSLNRKIMVSSLAYRYKTKEVISNDGYTPTMRRTKTEKMTDLPISVSRKRNK